MGASRTSFSAPSVPGQAGVPAEEHGPSLPDGVVPLPLLAFALRRGDRARGVVLLVDDQVDLRTGEPLELSLGDLVGLCEKDGTVHGAVVEAIEPSDGRTTYRLRLRARS